MLDVICKTKCARLAAGPTKIQSLNPNPYISVCHRSYVSVLHPSSQLALDLNMTQLKARVRQCRQACVSRTPAREPSTSQAFTPNPAVKLKTYLANIGTVSA